MTKIHTAPVQGSVGSANLARYPFPESFIVIVHYTASRFQMLVTMFKLQTMKRSGALYNNKVILCIRQWPRTALKPWCPGKVHRTDDGIGPDGEDSWNMP